MGCESSVCTFAEDIWIFSLLSSFIFAILYLKTGMTCEYVLFFLLASKLPCTLHHPVLCIRPIPVRNDEVDLGSSGVLLWLHRFFISFGLAGREEGRGEGEPGGVTIKCRVLYYFNHFYI